MPIALLIGSCIAATTAILALLSGAMLPALLASLLSVILARAALLALATPESPLRDMESHEAPRENPDTATGTRTTTTQGRRGKGSVDKRQS